MLDEYEFYQGAVLRQLIVNASYSPSFRPFLREGRTTAFVMNGRFGIYVKHSSKRMSPWRFTFTIEQAADLLDLEVKYPESFMMFVCGDDGIVTLSFAELHDIVDFQQTDNAWVAIARPPRSQYAVTGNKGELARKVARGVGLMLEAMQTRAREKYVASR
ncbi:hypothetical protein J4G48_0046975 [Bradyrhizobium barranii subsp. apii]|uniref:hypothetical protein n=1 Tax=Bradyrhizobium barranii TaxID=2992140 RepID=UPI001AA0CA83|nr:hypothetical protein [Bradyrhizobium barranii]UPT96467.1 hypothetical protein J4G48_0046975 [Bradyrhizobium barranii subsp. apii]